MRIFGFSKITIPLTFLHLWFYCFTFEHGFLFQCFHDLLPFFLNGLQIKFIMISKKRNDIQTWSSSFFSFSFWQFCSSISTARIVLLLFSSWIESLIFLSTHCIKIKTTWISNLNLSLSRVTLSRLFFSMVIWSHNVAMAACTDGYLKRMGTC